MGSSIRP